jgi:hypothetical protein
MIDLSETGDRFDIILANGKVSRICLDFSLTISVEGDDSDEWLNIVIGSPFSMIAPDGSTSIINPEESKPTFVYILVYRTGNSRVGSGRIFDSVKRR